MHPSTRPPSKSTGAPPEPPASPAAPPRPGQPLRPRPHLLAPRPRSRRGRQRAQPSRPPHPIVPGATHLGGCRRGPGRGARGKLPAAQEAGSVTAGAAKADPATSPPTLRRGSRRRRFTLLARQRRPRRLLRPHDASESPHAGPDSLSGRSRVRRSSTQSTPRARGRRGPWLFSAQKLQSPFLH